MMKSYLLPRARYSDVLLSIGGKERGISLPLIVEIPLSITEWSRKLQTTKTKLDKYYSDSEKGKLFNKIIRLFDPFRDTKYKISSEFEGQHVSNAWMKFWELLFYFKLIPRKDKLASFSVFCNACLPGSDILAINHFISVKTRIKMMDWNASSLFDKSCLQDDYNLHKNYPDKWISSEDTNGNVLCMRTQELIDEKIGKTKGLYTSDLGFDVSSDYNAQESLHAPYNLGQIVSACISLCDGGNMVIKMYTFFTPFSLSLLTILSVLFEQIYITKPVTSKVTNSEIYIVGIGYGHRKVIVDYLIKRLENISVDKSPFVNTSDISNWNSYQTVFSSACTQIFGEQIKSIDHSIRLFEKYGDKINKSRKEVDDIYNSFSIVDKWYIDYPLKKLRPEDRLNVQ